MPDTGPRVQVLDTQVKKEAEAAYEGALVEARAAGMNEETAVALAKQAATEARQNSDAFRKESNLQADTQVGRVSTQTCVQADLPPCRPASRQTCVLC